jgi:YD repeat-containing protein
MRKWGQIYFRHGENGDRFIFATHHRFDSRLLKTSATGTPQTRYTRHVYDVRGRFPTKTYVKAGTPGLTAPPGGVAGELLTEEVLSRNALGQATQIRTDQAVTTTIRYGALGREYERYSSTGAWERTFYNSGTTTQCPSGLTAFYTETLAGGGATARSCHDTLGRVVRSATTGFTGTWIYTDTTFDSSGRVRHQSQPYYTGQPAYWSTHSYDELGRLTQLIDPKGGVTTTAYAELLTTVTNPAGQQRREERNHLGEVVRVRDHNALGTRTTGAYIDYAYDATGNLISTQLKTDGTNLANGVPATITTTIGYDTWGRKTSLADPDTGSWTYQHNAFDELIDQQDAKGQKSLLGYDALGRLITREDRRSDNTLESATAFAYDKASASDTTVRGRLMDGVHTLFAANGTTQTGSVLRVFSYDDYKRPVGTAHTLDGGPTWSETQTYDAFGRVFQRLDASGADRGVQYVYNANGYLQQTLESAKSGARIPPTAPSAHATPMAA